MHVKHAPQQKLPLSRTGANWPRAAPGAKRPAGLALRTAVQAHNLALVLLSSWMSVSACVQAWRLGYRFWGTAYSDAEGSMATVVYVFYVSKLYELVDTVRPRAQNTEAACLLTHTTSWLPADHSHAPNCLNVLLPCMHHPACLHCVPCATDRAVHGDSGLETGRTCAATIREVGSFSHGLGRTAGRRRKTRSTADPGALWGGR